jgi:hypothetical protein
MKIRIASLLVVALVFGALVFAADAPKQKLSLDKLMTKEEQKATGVSKLSVQEQAALEDWLTRFAMTVATEVAKKSGGAGNSGTYAGVGQKHWVSEKIDSGAIIKLEDGSLWQISPIDKINTMLWLPIDNLVVIESKNPQFPYKLVSERDTAEAKLVSQ